MTIISDWILKRAERKLGEAINNHDVEDMRKHLERGARQVDFMQMQQADFGQGNVMIPACKFSDPIQLAKRVGLQPEGMNLLAQYGLKDPEASAPNNGLRR